MRQENEKQNKKQKSELAIGIPTLGTIDYRVASSLMTLGIPENTKVIWLPRVMIDFARNRIAKKAIEDNECEYILMLDDDMTFPPDTYFRLKEHGKDITGVLAYKRRGNYSPCVYAKRDNDYFPIIPNKFCEVDAIGSSVLLIKTEVFKKIKYPWFETYFDKDGKHWSVDMDFSKKAQKVGLKIYCDPTIEIGHIGDPQVITQLDFFEQIKKIKGEKND